MTGSFKAEDIAKEFVDTAAEVTAKFKKRSARLKRKAGQRLYSITSKLKIEKVDLVIKEGRVIKSHEYALAYYSQNNKKNPETPPGDQSANQNGRDHRLVHPGLEYALGAIRADPKTRDDNAFKALDLEIISALELCTQLLTTPPDQKPMELNRIDEYDELVQQLLVGCEPKAIGSISFSYDDTTRNEDLDRLAVESDGTPESVNILKITKEQAEQLRSRLNKQVEDYNGQLKKLSGIFFRADREALSEYLPTRLENLTPDDHFAKPHNLLSMLINEAYGMANSFNGLTSERLTTYGDTKEENKTLFGEIGKTKALLCKSMIYFGIEQERKK